jgi:hypothetical protein
MYDQKIKILVQDFLGLELLLVPVAALPTLVVAFLLIVA